MNPDYGTLADFQRFLREAHERELRVITELVVNHTSDQHPWFQRARSAPAGAATATTTCGATRPTSTATPASSSATTRRSNWAWDSVAGAYYWHRFYSHQPDLNFENADVRRAVVRALDTWLRMGVDGLRLDAVPYLFERGGDVVREPARDARVPQGAARARRRALRRPPPPRRGEPVAGGRGRYFGDGDECHMAFHFPLMPRLFMGAAHGGPVPDRRHPRPDADDPRVAASGRSSCGTTTS